MNTIWDKQQLIHSGPVTTAVAVKGWWQLTV